MSFIPPNNREVEEAVICACLIDPQSAETYVRDLFPEDFYNTRLRNIFEAIVRCNREGTPCDLVTVNTQIKAMGFGEQIPTSFLAKLVDVSPAASPEWAIAELKNKQNARSLIELANAIQKRALDPSADIAETLSYLQGQAEVLRPYGTTPKSACMVGDSVLDTMDKVDDVARNPGVLRGVDTGFSRLNFLTGGLRKKDLTILAARPSMGKTALAVNIARRASKAGFKVVVFSYEMPAQQLTQRMISEVSGVDLHRMDVGPILPGEMEKMQDAAESIHRLQMIIDDDSTLKTAAVERRIEQYAKKLGGVDLVIIDHIQILPPNSKMANANTDLGQITKDLKNMAKRQDVAILALSQLNRDLEKRGDPRPRLSDLRESGNIEQNADTVMFIFRPKYYKMAEEYAGQAEIYLGKNRQGPIGGMNAIFREETVRFDAVDLLARP